MTLRDARSRPEGHRAWSLATALSLFASTLVVVTPAHTAGAACDVVGTAVEAATSLHHGVNGLDLVDLEVDEVQSVASNASGGAFTLTFAGDETEPVDFDAGLTDLDEVQTLYNDAGINEIQTLYNNAVGGTFTLSFDGQGPTGPIAYNVASASVEVALEGLSNITDVTVTGTGVLADPWVITFVDPGDQDVPQISTNDGGLVGGTSTALTVIEGNLSLETALERLGGITDVSVAGSGTLGDPWLVTFIDPGGGHPNMVADSSGLVGDVVTVSEEAPPGMSAPIDPSGIAYVGGNLLISDSEINEEPTVFDGVNVWEMTTVPEIVRTAFHNDGGIDIEPTGLAYNPAGNGHVYISNDISDRIYDVDLGGDGLFGTDDDTETFFNAGAVGIGDPEDVAWDPSSQQLFIASGNGTGLDPRTVTPVSLGGNGKLGGGDDVLGATMDFSSTLGDLEGLGYRAVSGTLLLVDPTGSPEKIYEITTGGRPVRTIEIGFTGAPADVEVAPASSGGGDSLYLVDRRIDNNVNEPPNRDGDFYELGVAFAALAPFVDAGTDQTIPFGGVATLTGDAYGDGEGALTHAWSQQSGPGAVDFASASALSTTATFTAAGVYVLELTSTDGACNSSDTVQVTMSADPNVAPTVSAGPDKTVTLPSSAALSGSASDDGLPKPPGALTTTWSKVSGPGTVTFTNASNPSTTASFSVAGSYVLRLTANDGALQASDDVTVTVNPAPLPDHEVGLVDPGSGIWHLRMSNGSEKQFYYGVPGDYPFAGDWDCDGVDTPGLYRQSDGYVYLRNSNTQGVADIRFFFGNPGDVPMAGDFDNDGCDTVSIYRPSEARFYMINELGKDDGGLGAADFSFLFGNPGDTPVVGDWDGDGIDEIGLYRESSGFFYYRTTLTTGIATDQFYFGNPGDLFVGGDWGVPDGIETPGVFRPSETKFYLKYQNSQGIADEEFSFGQSTWRPVAGNW